MWCRKHAPAHVNKLNNLPPIIYVHTKQSYCLCKCVDINLRSVGKQYLPEILSECSRQFPGDFFSDFLFISLLAFLRWNSEIHPMFWKKVACATFPHACTHCLTHKRIVSGQTGSRTPTSGISVMEFVMTWSWRRRRRWWWWWWWRWW